MTTANPKTREWMQGYAACLGDIAALGHAQVVVDGLEAAGLTYHQLKDHGAETQDLGNIARARNAVKAGARA